MVFVASSDNTYDVLQNVAPSIVKFWADCPYRVFVGLNTLRPVPEGWVTVVSPARGWAAELLDQLQRVDAPFVILILDDFLITQAVDQRTLEGLMELVRATDIAYLRLVPQQRSIISRLIRDLSSSSPVAAIDEIDQLSPYFSGLQISVWKKTHLISSLKASNSIWDFEHIVLKGARHFATARAAPIQYIHVVEKGAWQVFAPDIFKRAGLPFRRGIRPSRPATDHFRLRWQRFKFAVVGYAWMRVKQRYRLRAS